MNKTKTLITMVAAALLVYGCGDKDKAASEQAESPMVEESSTVEMDVEPAGDTTGEAADMDSEAVEIVTETTSDAANDAGEMAEGAMDEAGETMAGATEAADDMAEAEAIDGQQVYMKACVACHATGVAGAPKLGDKEAWAPRIATGMDALMNSAINGKNVMPPRGTCASCSDEELKAAVEYMVSQSQ
jgi:cytochrome c5